MTAKYFTIFSTLVLSVSALAQNLPDAPKSKTLTVAPQYRMASVPKKAKVAAVSGVAAVVATSIVLSLRHGNQSKPIIACACPAIVPKK